MMVAVLVEEEEGERWVGRRRRSRWPLGSIIKGGTKDLEYLHFPYSWPASLTRLLQRLSQDEESGNRGRARQDRHLMVIKVLIIMRIHPGSLTAKSNIQWL